MAVIGATVFAYWEDQWRNQTPNDVTVSLTDLTANSEHGTVAEDATVIGYDIQGATAVSQTWYTSDDAVGTNEVSDGTSSTYTVDADADDLKFLSVEVSDGTTSYRSNYAQIRQAPPTVTTSASINPTTGFEGTTFVLTAPTSANATYSLDTFTFNEVDVSGELSGSNWDSTGKGAGELVATYTATNSGGTRTNDASSTVTQSVTNNLTITAPDTLAIEEEALVFEAPTTNLGSLQVGTGGRPETDILWNWDFGEIGAVYQNAHPDFMWPNNPNHMQGPRVVKSFTTYASTGETDFTVTLTGRDRFGNVETGTTTITVRSAAAHTWNATYVVSFDGNFTGAPTGTQISSEAALRTAVESEAGNSKVRFLFRPGERFDFNNSSFLLINHAGMWGSWTPGTRARFSTNIGSPGSGAWTQRTLFRFGSLTEPLLIRDINLVGEYDPVTGTCTDALFTAFQSLASPPKLTFHNIRSRGLNNTWSFSGGSPGVIAFSDCDVQDWKNYGCYIEQGNTAGTDVVVAAYGGTWTQNPAVGPLNAGDGRTNLRNTDFPDHGPFRLGVGSAICFNDVWFGSFNTWVSNNIHQASARLYHRTEPYDHRWYVNRCYLGGSGIDFDRFNVSQSVNRGGILLMDKVYWKGEFTKSGGKPFRGIGSVTLRNSILYDATTNGTVLCLELPDVNGEGSGVVAQSVYDLPVEVYNNTFISLRNGGTWNPIAIDNVYTDVTTVNNTLHAPNVNNSGSFDAGTFIGDEASLFRPLSGSPKLDSGSSTLWAIDDFFGNLRSTPVTQSHFENIAGAVAPAISGVPTISGTTTQGQTLTATEASVTGSPTPTTTWQWERSGTPISGATASTYVLTALDVGETLTVVQTETNSEGSDTAESAATATIAASGGSSIAHLATTERYSNDTTQASWTTSAHTASGDYVVVAVAVLAEPNNSLDLSSATADYGASSMTLLEYREGSFTRYAGVALFGLANPPGGAQTIDIDLGGSNNSRCQLVAVVDLDNVASSGSLGNTAKEDRTRSEGSSVQLTPTAADNLLLSVVATRASQVADFTPRSGTEVYDSETGGNTNYQDVRMSISWQLSGGTSATTVSFNPDALSADNWCPWAAIELVEA